MPPPNPTLAHAAKKRQNNEAARSAKEQKPSASTALIKIPEEGSSKSEAEVAQTLRTDLQSIRTLITCTICDQLLYEPWTLACGHTYCYSCLSTWFLVDKRKKTCPECRMAVKAIPAPSFLVKQLVEVFIARTELLPGDETTEQHHKRRDEENQIVETDRGSEEGLFKGSFTPSRTSKVYWDEEDGVERCRECSHEWTGGPSCENCGLYFEDIDDLDHNFSDSNDGDELDAVEIDLDADLDAEDYEGPAYWRDDSLVDDEAEDDDSEPHMSLPHLGPRRPGRALRIRERLRALRRSVNSSDIDGESEDAGSLEDFIVNDEDESPHVHRRSRPISNSREVIRIEDDDEDDDEETGDGEDSDEIYDGRRRRGGRPPRVPSVITVDSTSDSGLPGTENYRYWGWSPLDPDQESESERQPFAANYGSEESDTNTMVGGHNSDEYDEEVDDEDEDRERSATPRFVSATENLRAFLSGRQRPRRRNQTLSNTSVEDGEADDDDSGDDTSAIDRDGDVEMSVSPTASSHSSMSMGEAGNASRMNPGFGTAVSVEDLDEESSDASVRPANRRRRHIPSHRVRTPDYDPRISRLFARHQSDLRDVTALQSFEDWNAAPARIEPASRSRNGPSYRNSGVPPPCPSPLRRSQSPMISITISGGNSGRRPRGRRQRGNEIHL